MLEYRMSTSEQTKTKQSMDEALYPYDFELPQQILAVTLSELLEKNLPPRENILNPWLPKGGLCMVYAKRGIGKTFFALEIAMAVAYGSDFLSFNAPKPAKVLYIDGEMPANTMQERLASIKCRMNPNSNMLDPLIITPDLQDGIMPNLSTIEGQESIQAYIEEADLIIIDNISTLGGSGKENEAESWIPMQSFALSIRKKGKSVLFIHHAGKNGSQRGTSKREDILDTVITLKHASDYEPSDGACFDVHFEKTRGMIGDCINPISCKLTEIGWVYECLEQTNYLKVIELANAGLKQKDICLELDLSKGQVSKLLKKARINGKVKTGNS
jgi:KaiC/GvpD/RAD55 family RecA-like ATPase